LIWEAVEKFYGNRIADLMKESKYLKGITVTAILPNGKEASYEDIKSGKALWDFPMRDIENAYRDVTGLKVHAECWD
jgi:hypothetical protein